MKKTIFPVLLILTLFLTSCSMGSTIPENSKTFTHYMENRSLYEECVEQLQTLEFDALISRTDYYAPEGSENFSGLYVQNMEDESFAEYNEAAALALFENTDVKLVDFIERDGIIICAFDMCLPTKNFDYGIYYSSGNEPIYFGDPALELVQSGNGFSYEEKASYGAKFTYYTEKIEDHFFYYEIS